MDITEKRLLRRKTDMMSQVLSVDEDLLTTACKQGLLHSSLLGGILVRNSHRDICINYSNYIYGCHIQRNRAIPDTKESV